MKTFRTLAGLVPMTRAFCLGLWTQTAFLAVWVALNRHGWDWLILHAVLLAAFLSVFVWIWTEAAIEDARREWGLSDRVSDAENRAARLAAEKKGWM